MKKLKIFLLVYIFSLSELFAIDIPERLQKWAMQKQYSIGSFVLEKEISDIGISVKSIGNYRFEKGKGITWENTYPTKFTFFANDKFYSITTPQSTQKSELTHIDINKAISLLFKGDISDLEDKFELQIITNTPQKISIKCTPKLSQIKEGLKFAIVHFGINSLDGCHIQLANDTIIKIEFKEAN